MARFLPSAFVRGCLPLVLAVASSTGCEEHASARDSDASDGLHAKKRERMVVEQIEARGVRDPGVLAAMRQVLRHRLVPESIRDSAYEDRALPIGSRQTISQPYIVALMSELAHLKAGDRALEVGTGSGYQAAVLAQMGVEVYSIEIVEELAERAKRDLASLGYDSVQVRHGDGYAGWPERAPFDAIVITAAPPRIPEPLKEQLRVGGRMVVPVGSHSQDLIVLTRRPDGGFDRENVLPVIFVPMTGRAQAPPAEDPTPDEE